MFERNHFKHPIPPRPTNVGRGILGRIFDENEDFFEKNVFSARKSNIEKAADDFALRLVMPTWMLRGFIMGLPPRMRRGEMVHAIAWTFCVSDEMAERRLIEVGYGLE